MCDTWVATRDSTREGRVIFAKNSDRPVYDCQPLLLRPRQTWPAGERIRLEYVELPQVEETYAHLGSSPYWCWGYEEGLNEWGLAIGNEAIYTKPYRQALDAHRQGRPAPLGLLGMDMIRIAMERCRTARHATELIGALVEQYGQFGSGSPGKDHAQGSYDNAFICADPTEAWVVETAGRRWAARRLGQGCASISNQPSIRTAWDMGSADLVEHAQRMGWWPSGLAGVAGSGAGAAPSAETQEAGPRGAAGAPVGGKPAAGVPTAGAPFGSSAAGEPALMPFDFARAYIDDQTARQVSHLRAMRSRQLLEERGGAVTVDWMMRIARDHYEDTFLQGPYFDAADPDLLSLCMHASPAGFTWGNTASSCVAPLPLHPGELPVLWWTPGPPCTGCYVPFFPHSTHLPEIVTRAGVQGKTVTPPPQAHPDSFAPGSYWWLFKALGDWVKGGEVARPGCYAERQPLARARFDALERDFAAELPQVMEQGREDAQALDAFSARCVERVVEALGEVMGRKGA